MAKQQIGFIKKRLSQATSRIWNSPASSISAVMLASTLICSPAMAQQAGGIKGKITTEASSSLAGVVVTATSDVMPKPRSTVTKADGSYNLPLLLPGNYLLTFTSPDGSVRKMDVKVLLEQTSSVNVALDSAPAPEGDTEVIVITGSNVVYQGDSSLTNSIGEDVVEGLPIGQDYQDLLKLVPGIEYSENATLGPSAGGSGRDNKYSFDGVNVSLPLFGNLASQPSTHDIANVSMDRGGAKAVGFNRSGGFSINTTSKSGTNEFHGNLEYKVQNKNFIAEEESIEDIEEATSESDKSWITASLSGPLIEDELFFYGSYYRPEEQRVNKETAYGEVKDYSVIRDEYYGKLTWAPTDALLFNISQRSSEEESLGLSVDAQDADSTSQGGLTKQDIFILDGTYLLGDYTTLSFNYSDWENEGRTGPDTYFADVSPKLGNSLNLDNLDQLGLFFVPELKENSPDFDNAAAQVLIDRYGYVGDDGQKTGGGAVGGDNEINDLNYYRETFEFAIDHEMDWGNTYHNLHFGFQWTEGKEVLGRTSNGWGGISFLGGETPDDFESDIPVYYQARVEQMSLQNEAGASVPPITSMSETYNIEINDTIQSGDFTYNLGVLISKDILYGQGLKANSNNVSGYELAPGHKYKMHTIDFGDMIQPRLGVSWNYSGQDTVFFNFASYNPDASSLARAASWARNSAATQLVYFDQNGDFIGNTPASGSSGKFFEQDMEARRTDEYTLGATKILSDEWSMRGHIRHKKALHPWEDTGNGNRLLGKYQSPFGGVPDDIAEKGLYIENLQDYRDEVGGSSYVVAELDGATNKYWEASIEADYNGDRTYLNLSYVWSHYYGNYDQDVTSTDADQNLFIGSSNLADGAGRQLWDGKYGRLNGDRPHKFKAYGYYTTDWEANIGAYFIFQSGDVWEAWDGSLYGYSSSTIRYAEPAGSRRESSHWQLDLNYTQDFALTEQFTAKFRADLFNVFDNQTGYNYEPVVSDEQFGLARDRINPRRLQLSVNVEF